MQRLYHFALAFLGALLYGFPSRKLVVIGVTGTKGKTTTSNLIAQILESAGHKVGVVTTVNFKVGDREWVNGTKQTMPGRLALQKLLRRMIRAGCEYAVIETSSEGIAQYRQRFIDYSAAVFTNLSPEHIERHGGFDNYREAKVRLFEQVAKKKNGIGVYNLDDPNVDYFLKPEVARKYGYYLRASPEVSRIPGVKVFGISDVSLGTSKTEFAIGGDKFVMPLVGEFNVYNAAAAIFAALSLGVRMDTIKSALATARSSPGRFEIISKGQNFTVIVDYAHEPASLEALYKTVRLFGPNKIIGVLGAQGGGRDKWKRAEMGKIAAQYCDQIILTNEDPYDESPELILEDIAAGISSNPPPGVRSPAIYKLIDRREAIKKAISLAKAGDAVAVTGKGGEVWMCLEKGRKVPWNDKGIVEETLDDELVKK